MKKRISIQLADVLLWLVFLALLVTGLRMGIGEVVAQAMPGRNADPVPVGVERAGT